MEGGGGEAERGTKHRDGNADCEIVLPATVTPLALHRKMRRGGKERRNREEGEEEANLAAPHEKGDENPCQLMHELRI